MANLPFTLSDLIQSPDFPSDPKAGAQLKAQYFKEYGPQVLESAAEAAGLDPALLKSVKQVESGKSWNPNITSKAGAVGPLQLMGPAAQEMGVDRFNLEQNITGGAGYLKKKIDEFGGDLPKAIAAYNTGAGNVRKAVRKGGENWIDHLLPEPQNYLQQVASAYQGGMPLTPGAPEAPADTGPPFTIAELTKSQEYRALAPEAQTKMRQQYFMEFPDAVPFRLEDVTGAPEFQALAPDAKEKVKQQYLSEYPPAPAEPLSSFSEHLGMSSPPLAPLPLSPYIAGETKEGPLDIRMRIGQGEPPLAPASPLAPFSAHLGQSEPLPEVVSPSLQPGTPLLNPQFPQHRSLPGEVIAPPIVPPAPAPGSFTIPTADQVRKTPTTHTGPFTPPLYFPEMPSAEELRRREVGGPAQAEFRNIQEPTNPALRAWNTLVDTLYGKPEVGEPLPPVGTRPGEEVTYEPSGPTTGQLAALGLGGGAASGILPLLPLIGGTLAATAATPVLKAGAGKLGEMAEGQAGRMRAEKVAEDVGSLAAFSAGAKAAKAATPGLFTFLANQFPERHAAGVLRRVDAFSPETAADVLKKRLGLPDDVDWDTVQQVGAIRATKFMKDPEVTPERANLEAEIFKRLYGRASEKPDLFGEAPPVKPTEAPKRPGLPGPEERLTEAGQVVPPPPIAPTAPPRGKEEEFTLGEAPAPTEKPFTLGEAPVPPPVPAFVQQEGQPAPQRPVKLTDIVKPEQAPPEPQPVTPPTVSGPEVKQPQITPSDIHDLAKKNDIPWNNDEKFAEFTKGLTGKEHLDAMSEPELTKVKEAIEKGERPRQHDYSTTQVNLPPAEAEKVKQMAKSIPDADLAEEGREEEPHATILYGIEGDDPAQVRSLLSSEPPVAVTLGKTSIFPANADRNSDVVKIDVDSPDLDRLNAKLKAAVPEAGLHKDYKSHVTLAYTKPGLGQKYAGRTDLEGQQITLNSIAFNDRYGRSTEIPLQGSPPSAAIPTPAEAEPPPAPPAVEAAPPQPEKPAPVEAPPVAPPPAQALVVVPPEMPTPQADPLRLIATGVFAGKSLMPKDRAAMREALGGMDAKIGGRHKAAVRTLGDRALSEAYLNRQQPIPSTETPPVGIPPEVPPAITQPTTPQEEPPNGPISQQRSKKISLQPGTGDRQTLGEGKPVQGQEVAGARQAQEEVAPLTAADVIAQLKAVHKEPLTVGTDADGNAIRLSRNIFSRGSWDITIENPAGKTLSTFVTSTQQDAADKAIELLVTGSQPYPGAATRPQTAGTTAKQEEVTPPEIPPTTPTSPKAAKPTPERKRIEKDIDRIKKRQTYSDASLAEFFTPGRQYRIYNGQRDKVLKFHPATDTQGWSVEVIHIDDNGNPLPRESVRRHSTYPDGRKDMLPFLQQRLARLNAQPPPTQGQSHGTAAVSPRTGTRPVETAPPEILPAPERRGKPGRDIAASSGAGTGVRAPANQPGEEPGRGVGAGAEETRPVRAQGRAVLTQQLSEYRLPIAIREMGGIQPPQNLTGETRALVSQKEGSTLPPGVFKQGGNAFDDPTFLSQLDQSGFDIKTPDDLWSALTKEANGEPVYSTTGQRATDIQDEQAQRESDEQSQAARDTMLTYARTQNLTDVHQVLEQALEENNREVLDAIDTVGSEFLDADLNPLPFSEPPRVEKTEAGSQYMMPGTPGRQMPNAPIRSKVPSKGTEGLDLFEQGRVKQEIQQAKAQGSLFSASKKETSETPSSTNPLTSQRGSIATNILTAPVTIPRAILRGASQVGKKYVGTRRQELEAQLGIARGSQAFDEQQWMQFRTAARQAQAVDTMNQLMTHDGAWRVLSTVLGPRSAGRVSRFFRSFEVLGKQIGIPASRQPLMFDSAESIKEFDNQGKPVFGTRIFEQDPVTHQLIRDPVTNDPIMKEWRFTAQEGQDFWDQLSKKERFAVQYWVELRENLKHVFNVSGDIEGYMHHFWDNGMMDGLSQIFARKNQLKKQTAAPRKHRTEAKGFVKDFERGVIKGWSSLIKEGEWNAMIDRLVPLITDPIGPDGVRDGWTEIHKTQLTRRGKYIGQVAGGRQMPDDLYKEMIRYMEPVKETSWQAATARKVFKAMAGNLLMFSGTMAGNVFGSGIQYASLILDSAVKFGVTQDPRPFLYAVRAPLWAIIMPSVRRGYSPEVLGVHSNILSQYQTRIDPKFPNAGVAAINKGLDAILAAESAILGPTVGAVDTWAKRAVAVAVGDAIGLPRDPIAMMEHKKAYGQMRRIMDTIGLDYGNVNSRLARIREHPLGGGISPFSTYWYKAAQLMGHYFAAFNPTAVMDVDPRFNYNRSAFGRAGIKPEHLERISRLLVVGVTMALLGKLFPDEDERDRVGPWQPGMDRSLDRTGGVPMGKGEKGTTRYGFFGNQLWMGPYLAGRALLKKWSTGESPSRELINIFESATPSGGILLQGLQAGADYMHDPDNFKLGVAAARMLKPAMPLGRIAEGRQRLEGGPEVRSRTFAQELAESSIVPIPDEWTGVREIVRDSTTGDMILRNPTLEQRKFWWGFRLKDIDPYLWRKETNKQTDNAVHALSEAKTVKEFDTALAHLSRLDPVWGKRVQEGRAGDRLIMEQQEAQMIEDAKRYQREEQAAPPPIVSAPVTAPPRVGLRTPPMIEARP